MRITLEIPDEFASQITSGDQDPARAAIEALALEGYRNDRLSEADLRQLLGFQTRMEVHCFLKEHGVFLHYSADDLAHDRDAARRATRRERIENHPDPAGGRRAG